MRRLCSLRPRGICRDAGRIEAYAIPQGVRSAGGRRRGLPVPGGEKGRAIVPAPVQKGEYSPCIAPLPGITPRRCRCKPSAACPARRPEPARRTRISSYRWPNPTSATRVSSSSGTAQPAEPWRSDGRSPCRTPFRLSSHGGSASRTSRRPCSRSGRVSRHCRSAP